MRFFPRFCFLKQLALAADVASEALSGHIFAHLLYGLAERRFFLDGRLDGDIELLARGQQFLEAFAHAAAEGDAVVDVGERRQCVDAFAVEQDVELDEFSRGGIRPDGSRRTRILG